MNKTASALKTATITEADIVNSSSPTIANLMFSSSGASLTCAVLGHQVDHTKIDQQSPTQCVRCGSSILDWNDAVSRIAHTLSCFFLSHHYIPVAQRAGHNEYVCEKCGHPLLFEIACDPYSQSNKFDKRVNYGCGMFGHRVHIVKTGSTTTEYACGCGHSFIKQQPALTVIRHPLRCVLLGHLVAMGQVRSGWAEYLCVRCGHPFCFRLAAGD